MSSETLPSSQSLIPSTLQRAADGGGGLTSLDQRDTQVGALPQIHRQHALIARWHDHECTFVGLDDRLFGYAELEIAGEALDHAHDRGRDGANSIWVRV